MITEGIHLMDCAKGMKKIKKESVDLIFTDPPYVSEMWEEAYTKLAAGAMRILKPSGFCLTYTPQYRLDSVMDIMRAAGLRYYWIVPQLEISSTTILVHPRNAICLHKPILIFQKEPIKKAPRCFTDVIQGKKSKAHHQWEQSIHEALHLLSRFGVTGDLVVEPFLGSGTSVLAAKLLGFRYIGFEIDEVAFRTSQDRLTQRPLDLSSFTLEEVPA